MRYLALLLLWLASIGHVHAQTIHFLLSSDAPVVAQALSDIQSQLLATEKPVDNQVSHIDQFSITGIDPDDLLVAIGNKAAKKLASFELPNQTIISFTDKPTNAYLSSEFHRDNLRIVSLNQPTRRLVEFTDPIVGTGYKKNLLIAVSEQNTALITELENIAPLNYGQLKVVIVPKATLAAKVLEPHLFDAAALIAIQDPVIWTGKNAKWLLQQAFNYQVPVIGYSQSFLKAGALASVYSSLDDVATATSDAINDSLMAKLSSGFAIIYPEATITINPSITRVYQNAAGRLDHQDEVK